MWSTRTPPHGERGCGPHGRPRVRRGLQRRHHTGPAEGAGGSRSEGRGQGSGCLRGFSGGEGLWPPEHFCSQHPSLWRRSFPTALSEVESSVLSGGSSLPAGALQDPQALRAASALQDQMPDRWFCRRVGSVNRERGSGDRAAGARHRVPPSGSSFCPEARSSKFSCPQFDDSS